jgi:hypothetical protein
MFLPRQKGHTRAAIDGCKANDGILVVHSNAYSRELSRRHNITTTSLGMLRYGLSNLNSDRPVIFDHYIVEQLLQEKLEQENIALRDRALVNGLLKFIVEAFGEQAIILMLISPDPNIRNLAEKYHNTLRGIKL